MFDKEVKLPPATYQFLRDLLAYGKAKHDNVEVDLSEVQKITISNNTLTFSPPVKLKASGKLLSLSTTLTRVINQKDGIKLNLDNSPIDIEVKPNE